MTLLKGAFFLTINISKKGFCFKSKFKLFICEKLYAASKSNNSILLEKNDNNEVIAVSIENKKISYCPYCGRKIEEKYFSLY